MSGRRAGKQHVPSRSEDRWQDGPKTTASSSTGTGAARRAARENRDCADTGDTAEFTGDAACAHAVLLQRNIRGGNEQPHQHRRDARGHDVLDRL